ncbi:hypothetical protein EBS02_00440 [bacterium]|nr:hypothetical protein [bacterium]
MSALRTTKITDLNGTGPVEFARGIILPAGQIISGTTIINTAGILTATTFSGVGTGITTFGVVNEAPNALAIAINLIS